MSLPLFECVGLDASTVASPWCIYESECPRKGRCIVGAWRPVDGSWNRDVACLSCRARGEESRSKAPVGVAS